MKSRDKPLRYEPHAIRRLMQRGIRPEQVEQAVRRPDASRPARRQGAKRLEKKLSARRRLIVIAEETLYFVRIWSAWYH